jgi:hypothetical protein
MESREVFLRGNYEIMETGLISYTSAKLQSFPSISNGGSFLGTAAEKPKLCLQPQIIPVRKRSSKVL